MRARDYVLALAEDVMTLDISLERLDREVNIPPIRLGRELLVLESALHDLYDDEPLPTGWSLCVASSFSISSSCL